MAATALLLMASRAPARAQSYAITDLGGSNSTAGAINDQGQAVGTAGGSAVMWSGGRVIPLGTLGAGGDTPTAISSNGLVAGFGYAPGSSVAHAFLYDTRSRKIDIHSPSLFPAGTYAYGVNSSGQVVGFGYPTYYTSHLFLYSGGWMTDLGDFGGNYVNAATINDSGVIAGTFLVGNSAPHAFLYVNGRWTDLALPGGFASATAISGNGLIAGWLANGGNDVGRYSNGGWADLGTIAGAATIRSNGINQAGQVVGTATLRGGYGGGRGSHQVGFVSLGGRVVDLNTLIPAGSGWTISGAAGINDSGWILANAFQTLGDGHAVLLTPR